jgi:hypothetical protein
MNADGSKKAKGEDPISVRPAELRALSSLNWKENFPD